MKRDDTGKFALAGIAGSLWAITAIGHFIFDAIRLLKS